MRFPRKRQRPKRKLLPRLPLISVSMASAAPKVSRMQCCAKWARRFVASLANGCASRYLRSKRAGESKLTGRMWLMPRLRAQKRIVPH